jgi:soluble lytic murein transglycosylase
MNKIYFRVLVIIMVLLLVTLSSKALIIKLYPLKYTEYITKYSKEYDLDPYLVISIIRAESNFKITAKSNKDAHGLMQITSDTASWIAEQMKLETFKLEDLYIPEINIKMGCWYLNNLKQEFKGNVDLVLAAYNGGRGNVKNWLQKKEHSSDGETLQYIPFKETDKYLKRVKVNYNIYKYLYYIQ